MRLAAVIVALVGLVFGAALVTGRASAHPFAASSGVINLGPVCSKRDDLADGTHACFISSTTLTAETIAYVGAGFRGAKYQVWVEPFKVSPVDQDQECSTSAAQQIKTHTLPQKGEARYEDVFSVSAGPRWGLCGFVSGGTTSATVFSYGYPIVVKKSSCSCSCATRSPAAVTAPSGRVQTPQQLVDRLLTDENRMLFIEQDLVNKLGAGADNILLSKFKKCLRIPSAPGYTKLPDDYLRNMNAEKEAEILVELQDDYNNEKYILRVGPSSLSKHDRKAYTEAFGKFEADPNTKAFKDANELWKTVIDLVRLKMLCKPPPTCRIGG